MLVARPLERVIEELAKLPGIGRKSAQRIAMHLLRAGTQDVDDLKDALTDLKEKIRHCSICFGITELDPCPICADQKRDRTSVCVVQEPFNIYSIERGGEYRGLYHVLMGALSPLKGIGPEELKVKQLLHRVQGGEIAEVILALNPDVEGEATAIHLSRLLKESGVKVTRIALGLPVGSDIEYIDEITMSKAMEGRREI